jgi:hypothetical protein
LENELRSKAKLYSLDQIDKYQIKTAKTKENINNRIKNKLISNKFPNLTINVNNTTNSNLIDNQSNVNYNLAQTEHINLNNKLKSYNNDKKDNKSKIKYRKSLLPKIKIKKNILDINNLLMNPDNDNITGKDENINSQKKIYAKDNCLYLRNKRNNTITNNSVHQLELNKKFLNNNSGNIIYKQKMTVINFNNIHRYSLNTFTNSKNNVNNNNNLYHNLDYAKYAPIFSGKQNSNNLYDSYVNDLDLYKNKIKKRNYNNNNDNNSEYYSVTINNDSNIKKYKTKILPKNKPNIYNKTIDSLLNRENL